jgi:hypothetical protein
MSMYVCICVCICTCVNCLWMSQEGLSRCLINLLWHEYIHVYIYMYVCMYIYIYIYIHTYDITPRCLFDYAPYGAHTPMYTYNQVTNHTSRGPVQLARTHRVPRILKSTRMYIACTHTHTHTHQHTCTHTTGSPTTHLAVRFSSLVHIVSLAFSKLHACACT